MPSIDFEWVQLCKRYGTLRGRCLLHKLRTPRALRLRAKGAHPKDTCDDIRRLIGHCERILAEFLEQQREAERAAEREAALREVEEEAGEVGWGEKPKPRLPTVFEIPVGARGQNCSSCGAPIYFVRTQADRIAPVNPDGTSHFATCPHAATHRKAGSPRWPDKATAAPNATPKNERTEAQR